VRADGLTVGSALRTCSGVMYSAPATVRLRLRRLAAAEELGRLVETGEWPVDDLQKVR
jgi:hypothetical protein